MNKTAIPTNCPQSKSEPVAQAGRLTMVARLLLGGLLGLAVAVSAIMVAESWPTLGARATMVWARLWTVKGIARALFTVGALAGLARLGLLAWDAWFKRMRRLELHRIKAKHMRVMATHAQVRQLMPSDGRGGWTVEVAPDGSFQVSALDLPMERLLMAAQAQGSRPAQAAQAAPVASISGPAPQLPEFIPMHQLIRGDPTYRNLVLGQGVDGPVTGNVMRFVHGAIAGVTGWGKSMLARFLAWQIANSTDPVHLVLVDPQDVTLAPFERSPNALWPVASDERTILAVMQELAGELNHREELYRAYREQGVDTLAKYNALAPQPLVPIIVFMDEAATVLEDPAIRALGADMLKRARKYGFGLWFISPVWYADTIPSKMGTMFSTKVHFHAEKPSQARVLGLPDAAHLTTVGRAWVTLPGKTPVEIQAPFVSDSDLRSVPSGGPRHPAPASVPVDVEPEQADNLARLLSTPLAAKVKGLVDLGWDKPTRICQELTGSSGGKPWYDVNTLFQYYTSTTSSQAT